MKWTEVKDKMPKREQWVIGLLANYNAPKHERVVRAKFTVAIEESLGWRVNRSVWELSDGSIIPCWKCAFRREKVRSMST